jgi:hypothetical protein
LPTGVSFTYTSGTTATIAMTAAAPASDAGTYTLCLNASNGVGTPATQAFTLTINMAPAITSANNTTFTIGTAGSFTVTTSGLPPVSSITNANFSGCTASVLPSGVSFTYTSGTTATIAITAAAPASSAGTYILCLNASNGVKPVATQAFTLSVNGPPSITSASGASFQVGNAASFTVTTSGIPPVTSITNAAFGGCTPSTLPAGVSFTYSGGTTATIAMTAAVPISSAGTYSLCLNASNGTALTATQAFTLTIVSGGIGSGSPPTPPTPTSFTISVNGAPSATITAGQVATLSESGLPSGATGTVSFTSGGLTLCSFNLSPSTTSCTTSSSLGGGTYVIAGSFNDTDGHYGGSASTGTVTLDAVPSGTSPPAPPGPPAPGAPASSLGGYDLVGSDGGVFVFGPSGGFFGSLPGLGVLVNDIVGVVPAADEKGYTLVGKDGGVFTFGDAEFFGSLPGLGVHVDDIVGLIPTKDGRGYFLVGKDGGVFTFGDALFEGSLPGLGIHADNIVGIAATPDGKGYWVVNSAGGVFVFGDATSFGGAGAPVTAIAGTPDGGGYWLAGPNGSIFAFGDAKSFGSLPGLGVNASDILAIVPTADGQGYWLVGKDGGIFAFGDAVFLGSLPGLGIHVSDLVGAAPT